MTKPITDAQLAGWRDTLTEIERRLVSAERDVRAGLGTPDGQGYPQAQRGYFKGRLDAYTKARDALLPIVRREQERRSTAAHAPESPTANETGGERGPSPDAADVSVQGRITRRQVDEKGAAA